MKRLLAGWHLHAFAFSSDTVMNAADSEKGGKKGRGFPYMTSNQKGGSRYTPNLRKNSTYFVDKQGKRGKKIKQSCGSYIY